MELRHLMEATFQENLNKLVSENGEDPYSFSELFQRLSLNPKLALYLLPFSWPTVFALKDYSLNLWKIILDFFEEEFNLSPKKNNQSLHKLHKS